MTVTTIKVPVELRDELKRQAAAHHRTLAQHLQEMARREARDERLRAMRDSMAANPPDEDYFREAEVWLGPGWL